ncbi:MAG: YhbY family RNA-binding protein [Candidatus Didemnitutus sp.]|nr:YhbY family RNA-binding protein [Candidatus Didemnitutus sp.]
MNPLPLLTGAQRTKLRGLGQVQPDHVWMGRDGVTPTFTIEFNRQMDARELVKLRFTGGQDRKVRAALTTEVEMASACLCVGAVGHTALFWRPGPDGAKLL